MRLPPSLPVLALTLGVLAAPDVTRAEQSAVAGLYVRNDTDHTTVVSPRLHLRAPVVESTHVDLAYAVDVWTSASVDIVASASQAVTEQRDELDVGLDHVYGDFTFGGRYRYSVEPDYVSHGGSLSVDWDLADKATTLSWSAGGSADSVGRVGYEDFDEEVDTLTTKLAFTQVLDTDTLAQLVYDVAAVRGYQASAYRFVHLGGPGACGGSAALCRPEQNPRERLRHAIALRARRALGEHLSAGAGYRAYLDDWGLVAHTVKLDLAWVPTTDSTVALAYRFYTQNAADHYRAVYEDENAALFTSDKELSPLSSHRVALQLDWRFPLADGASSLLTSLEVAPSFYRYDDFPALDRVSAIEATGVVGMELP